MHMYMQKAMASETLRPANAWLIAIPSMQWLSFGASRNANPIKKVASSLDPDCYHTLTCLSGGTKLHGTINEYIRLAGF